MKRTLVCKYDKDGVLAAVGDSMHDLARQLGVTASTVSKAVHRGSKSYALVEIDDDEEDDE